MERDETWRRPGFAGAVGVVVDAWALAGGGLLLAVVLVNLLSVLGGIFWKPFPGDFELTEMGVAVAAFAFLPFCQLHGLNVTADIFTARAGPRAIGVFGLAASLAAAGFGSLLAWRMGAGLLDQKGYNYTTAILQIPNWWAYVPCIVSLVLVVLAALVTLGRSGRRLWAGEQAP